MKNRPLDERLGFAIAGIKTAWRRENSFRTQCMLAVFALVVTVALRPGWGWAAAIMLSMALVLALELMNAALEYLIDHIHPELAQEIGHAKDAAAGAVLIASIASLGVGGAMVVATVSAWF